MNNLLEFGVKRKPNTRRTSPVRRRRATPVRRRRTTPVRRKRSPPRKCNQKMTLARLRKIAMENGVNIYSEARTAINKRTGEPKKPKMVGCSTLMKRMNEAGLDYLYKVRSMPVPMDSPMPVPMSGPMPVPMSGPMSLPMDSPGLLPVLDENNGDIVGFEDGADLMAPAPCKFNETLINGNRCISIDLLSRAECDGPELTWYKNKCYRRPPLGPPAVLPPPPAPIHPFLSAPIPAPPGDPAWLVPPPGRPDDAVPMGIPIAEWVVPPVPPVRSAPIWQLGEDGEPLQFGRPVGGARPKMSQIYLGEIIVVGKDRKKRIHKVFRGLNGGIYYMKGKSGKKIYIDNNKLQTAIKKYKDSKKKQSKKKISN